MACFGIVTVLWVFSVCWHEFGHAWVAYRGGDHTVAEKGYLTMNPLRYTHPIYSLLLPVVFMMMGGIGLPGGAVYIDRMLLRSRVWETAVSLAGPAMTFSLILILGLLFKIGIIPSDRDNVLTISLAFLLRLEASAFLLNMLPVPPLDGFQAIAPWLPAEVRLRLRNLSNFGVILIFILIFYVPALNKAFNDAAQAICGWFGVERIWSFLGYRAYRFWEH